MAVQAAAFEYAANYNYGSAAPAIKPREAEPRKKIPEIKPSAIPIPKEQYAARTREAAKVKFGISLFALTGSVFVAILMVFVVLAQVSYTEITSETVKLNSRLQELEEEERRLEIAYESVFDMNRVESYAKDVLGMSKLDSDQVSVLTTIPVDRAEILSTEDETSVIAGLGSFLSTLLEYFK